MIWFRSDADHTTLLLRAGRESPAGDSARFEWRQMGLGMPVLASAFAPQKREVK
jgi:hypothetical protein